MDLLGRATGDAIRARILLHVRENPGVHLRALQRELGLSPGQAVHHLRRLGEDGLLVGRRGAHYTHFFPAGAVPLARAAVGALRHPARRAVAEGLAAGRSTLRDLGLWTSLAPSTLRHHLAVLQEAGAVEGEGGRPVRWRLTSDGLEALALLRPRDEAPAPAPAPLLAA